MRWLVMTASLLLWLGVGNSAVLITASEENGSVLFRISGSLDTSLLGTRVGAATERQNQGFLKARSGVFVNIPFLPTSPDDSSYDIYDVGNFDAFGASTSVRGRATGIAFGITQSGQLLLSRRYQSGSELSGLLVFDGATLDSIGVDRGVDTLIIVGNTVDGFDEIRLTTPAPPSEIGEVPVPASFGLFVASLALGGSALKRRKDVSSS